MEKRELRRFAWLSLAAAILTIGLKLAAYLLTGSIGMLSDALESLVNLVAAIVALVALTVAARPPDEEHAYGHDKVEYFASGVEGGLILIAAYSIGSAAIGRLIDPQPLEQVGLGIGLSVIATVINLGVARVLLRAGRRYRSIVLEADAQHLMSDVWTSFGVVAGVLVVAATGILWLDPLIALLVAVQIVWAGVRLVQRSALGLMDSALPADARQIVHDIFEGYRIRQGIAFHALRTRQSGSRSFISFHVLVPGDWSVRRGHRLLEAIEHDIRCEIDGVTVFTHLEPIDDPASFQDVGLERPENT